MGRKGKCDCLVIMVYIECTCVMSRCHGVLTQSLFRLTYIFVKGYFYFKQLNTITIMN